MLFLSVQFLQFICFTNFSCCKHTTINTAWNASKYVVFSGPWFPVFGLNTGKYRPERTPYWDTFHAVQNYFTSLLFQPVFTCSKSRMETREICEICSKLKIKIPERLLSTLNRFHVLFWCFYCWLWTSKCRLG